MEIKARMMLGTLIMCVIFVTAGSADASNFWTIDQLDDIYLYEETYVVPVLGYSGSKTTPIIKYSAHELENQGLVFSESFSTSDGVLSLKMPIVKMQDVKIIVTENNGYAFIDLLYQNEGVGIRDVGKKVLNVEPHPDYDGIYTIDTNTKDIKKTLLLLPLVLHSDDTGYAMPLLKNPFVKNDGYIVPLIKIPTHKVLKSTNLKDKWNIDYDALVILDYEEV